MNYKETVPKLREYLLYRYKSVYCPCPLCTEHLRESVEKIIKIVEENLSKKEEPYYPGV